MEQHITVLKDAAIEALHLNPSSMVVDATYGSGGHSKAILEQLGENGGLVALDADQSAIDGAESSLGDDERVRLVVQNFRKIDEVLVGLEIENVDAILADLGWRMEQFSGSGKGFSFRTDEPLHMTYGDPKKYAFTAHDIVNEWKEEDIANVLKGYGEERFARRIARAIAKKRDEEAITSSVQLAEIVESAVPTFSRIGKKVSKIHPATRTFQALRIAVNDEFDALEEFIKGAILNLDHGGRLAIITFHSLEDRIVKHLFRDCAAEGEGVVITKKPLVASEEEIAENPRARSAKLRIFEKT